MIKATFTSTIRLNGGRSSGCMVGGGTAKIDTRGNILLFKSPEKTALNIYIDRLRARERRQAVRPTDTVREYRVKRNLIKAKALAFFSLKSNFYAFYSISFPPGTDDKSIVSYFNVWRTRVTKDFGQFDYLRVSERQKNGTLHFHLLTDRFFPIRKLNGYMATTLGMPKYNGVDVRKVHTTEHVVTYLTKYMSKGEKMEGVHPYRCSRLVSALATAVYYDDNQLPDLGRMVEQGLADWKLLTPPDSFIKIELFFYEKDNRKISYLAGIADLLSGYNLRIKEAFQQREKLRSISTAIH